MRSKFCQGALVLSSEALFGLVLEVDLRSPCRRPCPVFLPLLVPLSLVLSRPRPSCLFLSSGVACGERESQGSICRPFPGDDEVWTPLKK